MALATGRRDKVDPRDNPRRAAVVLLAMLIATGVVLAVPFVFLSIKIDNDRQPSAAALAAIARADCPQLRSQLARLQSDSFSDLNDIAGRRRETVDRVVERGAELHCRPVIAAIEYSD